MDDFPQAFEERLREIESYLDLLEALEKQVQLGPPRIGGGGPIITVQQQRILYSSVYLQLYNLVESTIMLCINAVSTAVVEKGPWLPSDLCHGLRREWVRFMANTHKELSYENRLNLALALCDHLTQSLPVASLKVEKGGGSWDDEAIYAISVRLGLPLRISPEASAGAKRPFRNEQGSLAFIKSLRNNLAHGMLSFVECGDNVTARDLRDLTERTSLYLREVVNFFKTSIDTYAFLLPARRPKE